jgi:hypothetical protein
MKFFSAFLLTALLSYAGGFYFSWWIIAVAAFAVALVIPQKSFFAFLAGFTALFFLWAGLAAFIDVNNRHILSARIAEVMFKTPSHWMIITVTGLVGALVGGFAALTGNKLRALLQLAN